MYNIKTLNPKLGETIVITVDPDETPLDMAQQIFNAIVENYPLNKVIMLLKSMEIDVETAK